MRFQRHHCCGAADLGSMHLIVSVLDAARAKVWDQPSVDASESILGVQDCQEESRWLHSAIRKRTSSPGGTIDHRHAVFSPCTGCMQGGTVKVKDGRIDDAARYYGRQLPLHVWPLLFVCFFVVSSASPTMHGCRCKMWWFWGAFLLLDRQNNELNLSVCGMTAQAWRRL